VGLGITLIGGQVGERVRVFVVTDCGIVNQHPSGSCLCVSCPRSLIVVMPRQPMECDERAISRVDARSIRRHDQFAFVAVQNETGWKGVVHGLSV
jgi:hypothetical protein